MARILRTCLLQEDQRQQSYQSDAIGVVELDVESEAGVVEEVPMFSM